MKIVMTDPKKYNGKHVVLKKGNARPRIRGNAGSRILVPDGYEFLSDAIKAIIEMERKGISKEEATKKVGLFEHSYTTGRDVVLLSERNDLPDREAAIVRRAMERLDHLCQVRGPYKSVKPIAQKVWGKKGHRLKSDTKLLDNFRSSISYVHTTCITVADIDVPYLSDKNREAIISELEEAETALISIRKRINGSIK